MHCKLAVSLVLSLVVVPNFCGTTWAAEVPPTTASRPATAIRVALLPVVAAWNDSDATARREKAAQGTEELAKVFSDRGFGLVGSDDVEKAVSDLKVDLSESSQRTVANLEKIGKALGADWVVLVAVTDLKQQRVKAPITDTDELVTSATMQTWVLDRSEGRTLLGGESSACPVHSDPGSRKPRNVIGGAVREALRTVLAPFPIKKERAD